MNTISRHKKQIKTIVVLMFFICLNLPIFAQTTTVYGIVKDSLTNEPVPFATVHFDGTTIGGYTGDDGSFRISNAQNKTNVIVSLMGYRTVKFSIPAGKTTNKNIFFVSEDKKLDEVVIRPQKEKYSKKNNPAVELIKKVINNKKKNSLEDEDYFQRSEYERILFAFNEFKPNQPQFKHFKFLPNYVATSDIDSKPILPFSVRETISDYYYRKNPKIDKRIVKGYENSGLDKAMEIEGLDAVINEVFKDVNINDNSITLLFQEFVSPLSEHRAVSFFRWYINDTITIDNKKYINLAFVPFNTRDIGFTGYLNITNDGNYAVKKAVLRVPVKSNINFVDEMIIQQDFYETESGQWAPEKQSMSIDLSYYKTVKFYVDKSRTFDKYVFNQPKDSVYALEAPVTFTKRFDQKDKEFWDENRPIDKQIDYRMDEMMNEITQIGILKFMVNIGKFIGNGGFVRTNSNPEKNDVEIGNAFSFYSYNSVEGNRFRLTGRTTPQFNRHLFLYGYGAYGTKDGRPKYYGEATVTFDRKEKNMEEFPKNNLTVGYKYDMNNLGQHYTTDERDNIWMSIKSTKNEKLTYNRQSLISYEKEYHSGLSFKVKAQTFDERPAGKLKFEVLDENNNTVRKNSLRTSQLSASIRFAPTQKFFQYQRQRYDIPAPGYEMTLTHTTGIKGLVGSQYNFNKSSFVFEGQLWVAQFGKIYTIVQADKVWGEVPFPILLSPNANSSFTVQRGAFNLVEPLEFIHDQQLSWNIEWRMGGLIFNRIPFLNQLKLREVAGFRGVWGDLRERNDPTKNHKLFLFPDNTYKADKKPYMEYNIGVENILSLFRIDYVRRINYLGHPDVNKNGIRFSAKFSF